MPPLMLHQMLLQTLVAQLRQMLPSQAAENAN
jgi:hypothetical protein